jgi:Fe-S cluster assembly protein SufB
MINTDYKFGWKDEIDYQQSLKGLNQKLVTTISNQKKEPAWMLEKRLEALAIFTKMPLPSWGPNLSKLNFSDFSYYQTASSKTSHSWQDVPDKIKDTFEKLGVSKAEREILAGVKSQYESEVVYSSLKKRLAKQGVIFESMDKGLVKYPEIVKKYFGTVVNTANNKFSALNTAVWSGGTFLYVPKGVKVDLPLQAYFRLNSALTGQFERSLLILEEEASVHYLEGCSAPIFSQNSLHCGVVEVIVGKKAFCQYSTIQNWYTNVYNLVTKKARVLTEGEMVWLDGNFGSKTTMKYPSCLLEGKKAKGQLLSVSMAVASQDQDTGTKMIHLAPETKSKIVSKSVCKNGGVASFRGLVNFSTKAKNSQAQVVCDGLLLDSQSQSNTYPTHKILNTSSKLNHEATVSPIKVDEILYLQSRGFSKAKAKSTIVSGFLGDVIEKLPLEQSIELNRLIEMEMEN